MADAHRFAGDWLRGVPDTEVIDGVERKIHRQLKMGEKHPLFVKLAENLRFALANAKELKDKATGVLGPVLPEIRANGRRQGAPVSVVLPPGMIKTASGLIVPQGMASQ